MPRLKPVTLTDDERSKLVAWTRRPKTAQRLALRARIVLAAADGRTNTAMPPTCGSPSRPSASGGSGSSTGGWTG